MKKNIIINYVSQIFTLIIGIIILPIYLKYMGQEAYGLVALYSLMQAAFNLLDIGLSATLIRETARYNGKGGDKKNYFALVMVLEIIFFAVALALNLVSYLFSKYIAENWLEYSHLDTSTVSMSVFLMIATASFRWMAGLQRGKITGFERIVWLSYFNMIISSLRFLCVIPIIIYYDNSPVVFFCYQLVIASIELFVLKYKSMRILQTRRFFVSVSFSDVKLLKSHLKFTASMSLTAIIWFVITQTDKFILSRLVSLSEYGFFALAVVVASTILIIRAPVSTSLMPRLSNLWAQNNLQEFLFAYRYATQLTVVVSVTFSTVLYIFAYELLMLWINDAEVVHHAAPILRLYLIGNCVMTIAAFPYYAQYARGDLSLHLVGNVIFLSILVPSVVYATLAYQAIGAGVVWACINILAFIFWLPVVYRKLKLGIAMKWYFNDVLFVACTITLVGLFLKSIFGASDAQLHTIVNVLIATFCMLFSGVIAANLLRRDFFKRVWR